MHKTNQFFLNFTTGVATFFFALVGQASDFHSPRTAGLGGAGHASPLLNDSIYLNPSYTSFTPLHSVSVNYSTYRGGQYMSPLGLSDYYGHNINASLFDGSSDSLFQAGVGYTIRDDASLLHFGASKAILRNWGIGFAGKMIFPSNESESKITNASVSISYIPTRWFQFSLMADNLFSSAEGKAHGLNREYILGTKISYKNVIYIYLDPHLWTGLPEGQSTWGYEAGAEFPFFSDFYLRGGLFKNSTTPFDINQGVILGDGYGLGVGWLAPKLGLNYGYSRVRQPVNASSHIFGLSVYF